MTGGASSRRPHPLAGRAGSAFLLLEQEYDQGPVLSARERERERAERNNSTVPPSARSTGKSLIEPLISSIDRDTAIPNTP